MPTTLVKQGANYEQDKKKSQTTCSHYMQFQTGIYTIPHWHSYNSILAFIQFHTGIYTIPHWHLYNPTLAFIQKNGMAFIQVMSVLHFFLTLHGTLP